GCSGDDVDVTFDDEAAGSAQEACAASPPAIAARLRPFAPLSVFDGAAVGGTWRLTLVDAIALDTGALQRWCLEVRSAGSAVPTPGGADCCSEHGEPGCGLTTCEQCVCADLGDAFCCAFSWDS